MVQDEVIYSAREIVKGDAHPGGYVATGGYGGIMGSMTAGPYVTFIPTRKHTWKSDLRIDQLPTTVGGLLKQNGVITPVEVAVKDSAGELIPSAIPKVIIVKGDVWYDDSNPPDGNAEKGLLASLDMLLEKYPLAGIVAEGTAPYAGLSGAQEKVLAQAALSGIPVVKTARGDVHGFVKTNPNNLVIEGSNSISTKARLLLTAALMKFGSLPPAADPSHPTPAETAAIKAKVALYQKIFDTH
jgi:L-asparaginase